MMAMLTRRHLLQGVAAGTLATIPGLSGLAFAETAAERDLLVVVFLRGGCDALNLLAPVNDRSYLDARPPELRVLDAGDRQVHRIDTDPVAILVYHLHTEPRQPPS